MNLEANELMTNDSLINWLSVLSDGYAKPDLNPTGSGTGTVRETKNYMPFIMSINSKLCEMSGIECPDVSSFLEFDKKKEKR